MEENYSKAFKEVMEILKYVPEESINKIPKDMLEMFESEMDKNYQFSVDELKEIEQQNIMEETKAILSNIYRDYWATPEQRQEILKNEQKERDKIEEEKRKLYNPEDIFKKRSNLKQEVKDNSYNTNLPVEVKKKNFYTKLVDFIKRLLKINK